MRYEDTEKWKRLHTELGFNPHPVGDYTKCVCRDCKYREKYTGPIKDPKLLELVKRECITKCVCEIYNDNNPIHHIKPLEILEINASCEFYEKEDKA